MILRPPRSTRTYTLFPDTTLFRSAEMLDDAIFTSVRFDQLEIRAGEGTNVAAWDLEAWAGGDIWKLALESEGEYAMRSNRLETLEKDRKSTRLNSSH